MYTNYKYSLLIDWPNAYKQIVTMGLSCRSLTHGHIMAIQNRSNPSPNME